MPPLAECSAEGERDAPPGCAVPLRRGCCAVVRARARRADCHTEGHGTASASAGPCPSAIRSASGAQHKQKAARPSCITATVEHWAAAPDEPGVSNGLNPARAPIDMLIPITIKR